MSDPKKIISVVMNDEKLINSKSFQNRVYKDEPILRTASQLCKPKTPERIEQMKKIAFSPDAYWKTSAWLFYTQGKFMEDYEDDYNYDADFSGFYTTYRDLTAQQLRGYFSWRTKVRNGIITKTSSPYAYIYSYELINQIGTKSLIDGFNKLKNFGIQYKQFSSEISNIIDSWLIDYAAYNQLDTAILSDNKIILHDKMLIALKNWEKFEDDDIFDALCNLSDYNIYESPCFTDHFDKFKKTAANSFKKLSEYFRENRKKSLFANYFGNLKKSKYHIFESAVFYDRTPLRSFCCKINEIRSISCMNGAWSCESYPYKENNKHIGDFLKSVDSILRERLGYSEKLKCDDVSKIVVSIIQREADKIIVQKSETETKKIEIDISKLEDIRKASEITRDKLIVEEAYESEEIPEITAPENSAMDDIPLNISEYEFLKTFLYGGDWRKTAESFNSMPSILADAVNEKLFDRFGDTVIDFSGDVPELIEDYIDELKGMIKP